MYKGFWRMECPNCEAKVVKVENKEEEEHLECTECDWTGDVGSEVKNVFVETSEKFGNE